MSRHDPPFSPPPMPRGLASVILWFFASFVILPLFLLWGGVWGALIWLVLSLFILRKLINRVE
jgi:hypothetical protein